MAKREKGEFREVLERAREQFQEGEDGWSDLKLGALDDLRFGRLGDQWPVDARREREDEGRPCLTINDLPASIRQVVNDARQNRPQIKVDPVDSGADPMTAEVLGGIVKHIERISHADVAYDMAIENAASMRVGYLGVEVDYAGDDTFESDIKITGFANTLAVTGDAKTQSVDSSDWRYAFVTERKPKREFEAEWPEYKYEQSDFADDGHLQEWFDSDGIRVARWYEREEKKRRILLLSDDTVIDRETYEKNKDLFDEVGASVLAERDVPSFEIIHRLITGCDVLEEKRWRGSKIPIVPVWGEMINEEGRWHIKSMITDAKDPQRMFNLGRSVLSEMVGRSPKTPWIGPAGTFDADMDKWTEVNQKIHAFLEYDAARGKPERPPSSYVQVVIYLVSPCGVWGDNTTMAYLVNTEMV